MARPKSAYPSYRLHKPSGKAIVTLGHRMYYLGEYGSPESHAEYDRLIAEWVDQGRPSVMQADLDQPNINELVLAYWSHCQTYYVKNGKTTGELENIRTAMRPLVRLYGESAAEAFTPQRLRAVRERMMEMGWCRRHINKQVCRVRRLFKWAVAEGMLGAEVWHALTALEPLKQGRSQAREKAPILPVEDAVVEATLPELDATLADMVRLQRLTGMRPGEVRLLVPRDVDRSGDVWWYRPSTHKMEHHDKHRVVPIGPKAQAILAPYLVRGADEYCFRPTRSHRDHYTKDSYRERVWKACARAFPPPENLSGEERREWIKAHRWAPNQLRHASGTEIRAKFGLEAAQVILGHSRADVTQVYAERDMKLAERIAREVG